VKTPEFKIGDLVELSPNGHLFGGRSARLAIVVNIGIGASSPQDEGDPADIFAAQDFIDLVCADGEPLRLYKGSRLGPAVMWLLALPRTSKTLMLHPPTLRNIKKCLTNPIRLR